MILNFDVKTSPLQMASTSMALIKARISPSAFYILWRCRQGSSYPRMIDLVNEMGIKFPTLSVNVNRMIDAGLLARRRGYGSLICITRRGAALLKKTMRGGMA